MLATILALFMSASMQNGRWVFAGSSKPNQGMQSAHWIWSVPIRDRYYSSAYKVWIRDQVYQDAKLVSDSVKINNISCTNLSINGYYSIPETIAYDIVTTACNLFDQ